MSMHLFIPSGGATGVEDRALSLITSYENGCVKLWRYRNVEKERSIEGVGWECLWSSRQHVESGERSVQHFVVPALHLFQLTHSLAQPLRQSWQQRFRLTDLSPCRCRQTTLLGVTS